MSKFWFAIGLMLLMLFSWGEKVAAQSTDAPVPLAFNHLQWAEFKAKTETLYHLSYFEQPGLELSFEIEVQSDTLSLSSVLRSNLSPMGLEAYLDDRGYVFITAAKALKPDLAEGFFIQAQHSMAIDRKEDGGQSSGGLIATSSVYVQKTIVVGRSDLNQKNKEQQLSGYVTNSTDGSAIIGGTVFIEELATGTATDENGYYQINLKPGRYTLIFKSLETIEKAAKIDFRSAGKLDLALDQNLFLLQEVEVKSSQNHNVRGTQMGFEKLTGKMIKEIPVVLGEQDVIKVALLLPGVTSIGEGASGFNVRGSPADQNQFYIENTPIYNTSHLMGFFSAFNPDIIDNFTLYKGTIPAKYGGRLSSIFDITTKTGNMERFSARGGISPITARLMVEGPVVKEKVSFITGIRSTYSNWVLQYVKDPEIRNSKAYFGDFVLGLDARVNSKNSLKLFGYFSHDQIKLANSTRYTFSNQGASIAWFHGFGKKHDLNLSFVYSDYFLEEQNTELEIAAFKQNYRLSDNEIKLDINLGLHENHNFNLGLSGKLYLLDRGSHLPMNDMSSVSPIDLGNEKAIESAIFVSDEWKITPLITLSGGLRYNLYTYLGPQSVYQYKSNSPMSPTTITDTLTFGQNEPAKTYTGLDYRLSANFLLNTNLSLKAGYNRLHQYIFMLSNTIALSPSDTWKLADYNIKPMTGDQFSAGVYLNIGKNLETSVEAYYKYVNNLVEYKDGADLMTSKVVEWEVLQGRLDAYGIEFMLKKPFGRLNGWVNYSYSKSSVLVDNRFTGEQINFGQRYPSNYDHPHVFNLALNYKSSRRLVLSANVIYSSGRPITYPTAIYYLDGQKILHYSQRNEYRIPDYFRIDLAVKIEGNLVSKKLAHGSFIFSVYNLTGRKNAYSVYFKSENGSINGYKMSIFGTQIFSITYDFKLGNYAS